MEIWRPALTCVPHWVAAEAAESVGVEEREAERAPGEEQGLSPGAAACAVWLDIGTPAPGGFLAEVELCFAAFCSASESPKQAFSLVF